MTDKNYTVPEVAEICRVTPWTIRQWLNDAKHPLKGIKPEGSSKWLIPATNLREYLETKHG